MESLFIFICVNVKLLFYIPCQIRENLATVTSSGLMNEIIGSVRKVTKQNKQCH